jgi:hypothetical protein
MTGTGSESLSEESSYENEESGIYVTEMIDSSGTYVYAYTTETIYYSDEYSVERDVTYSLSDGSWVTSTGSETEEGETTDNFEAETTAYTLASGSEFGTNYYEFTESNYYNEYDITRTINSSGEWIATSGNSETNEYEKYQSDVMVETASYERTFSQGTMTGKLGWIERELEEFDYDSESEIESGDWVLQSGDGFFVQELSYGDFAKGTYENSNANTTITESWTNLTGTSQRTDYEVENNEWAVDDENETEIELLEYQYKEESNLNNSTNNTIPSEYSSVSVASTLYTTFANYFAIFGFLTLTEEEKQIAIDSVNTSGGNNQQTTSLVRFQQTNDKLYQKFLEIYGTEGVKKLENILNAGWKIMVTVKLPGVDYVIDRDKKVITVSRNLALDIKIDDLGQQRYKAWRLMVALEEVNNISDEVIQWRVTRNSNQTQAVAVPANGQTITDLANLIGLDANAWQSWLYHDPNSFIKIINNDGTISEINFTQLTLEHKLSSNNTFKVPNVILVLYGGHAGTFGKIAMQWTKEISYLKEAGFYVQEIKQSENTGNSSNASDVGLAVTFKNEMGNKSVAKELQGIYIGWCHGSMNGQLQIIPDTSTTSYAALGMALTYKLGFVVIKACYSEVGKPFLLSSSPGAMSWFTNADRVLDPAFPFGAPYVWAEDTRYSLKDYLEDPDHKKLTIPKFQLTQSAPSIIISALPPGSLGTNSKRMIKSMPGIHLTDKIIKGLREIIEK